MADLRTLRSALIEQRNVTPLITIWFVTGEADDERVLVRHWYHVPALDDRVALDHDGHQLEGKVWRVLWHEDGVSVWFG